MLAKRSGFSLTELLVVIVLVTILAAVGLIALQKVRRAQGQTQALNNLKALGLACHNSHGAHNYFPPAWGSYGSPAVEGSLHFHLLPFLKQDALYRSYYGSAAVPEFSTYADPAFGDGAGVQNFAANLKVFTKAGLDAGLGEIPVGSSPDGKTRFANITDGSSNTLFFATRYAYSEKGDMKWGAPNCSAHAGRPFEDDGAFFGRAIAMTEAHADSTRKPTFQLAPSPLEVDCTSSSFAHSFDARHLLVLIGDGSTRALKADISARKWNEYTCPCDGNIGVGGGEAEWERP